MPSSRSFRSGGLIGYAVRSTLLVLFAVAATRKLIDPSLFIAPLTEGLGLDTALAGAGFVAGIGVLLSICAALICTRRLGIAAAGVFFLAGAGYTALLAQRGYQRPLRLRYRERCRIREPPPNPFVPERGVRRVLPVPRIPGEAQGRMII